MKLVEKLKLALAMSRAGLALRALALAFLALALALPALAPAQVQPVDNTARTAGKTTEVLVSNAAGGTAVPSATFSGRRTLEIQNLGPNDIYCTVDGSAPVVNKSRKVAANGGSFALAVGGQIPVKCIADAAAQVTGAATIATEIK